jgi:hypothetical protein
MPKRPPFTLAYADAVLDHLRAIESKYHSTIKAEMEMQLLHEPGVETRNRKPLLRPIGFEADWELRLGQDNRFRVFYRVDAEARKVHVLAIGVKHRSALYIGGEEFEG